MSRAPRFFAPRVGSRLSRWTLFYLAMLLVVTAVVVTVVATV